jgi:hypothetical protein
MLIDPEKRNTEHGIQPHKRIVRVTCLNYGRKNNRFKTRATLISGGSAGNEITFSHKLA